MPAGASAGAAARRKPAAADADSRAGTAAQPRKGTAAKPRASTVPKPRAEAAPKPRAEAAPKPLSGPAKRAAAARKASGVTETPEVAAPVAARALAPLVAVGHHLLPDRCARGSRHAQVELVVVGPGGVFLLETKASKHVAVVGGRVYRGGQDVTDELSALGDLRHEVEAGLAEVGLAPGEVRAVVVLAGEKGIDEQVGTVRVVGERDVLRVVAGYGARLTDVQVYTVLARALTLLAPKGKPARRSKAPAESEPTARFVERDHSYLMNTEDITSAVRAARTPAPIEDWMAFLHPAQAKLACRSFNGPARITGTTGTGKTLVGLHRAAHLARTRPGTILFTTYVRTMPGIMRAMLRRMAPDIADRVEFAHVHAVANRVLKERGVWVNVQAAQVELAMEKAWHDAGAPGLLAGSGLERRYWEEEVQYVLKARGIARFEQYADMVRTGRRHRLNPELRRAVWDLYQAYSDQLAAHGLHDWVDVILLAEAELKRVPATGRYAAVIVDEEQDLTCAMVRLLHSFVGNAPDGLTLIGDAGQSIYPGGYTLAEAGISLAGRGAVLEVNYRNTSQIVAFASRLVAGDARPDVAGAAGAGAALIPRSGAHPVIERCLTPSVREDRMIERIRSLLADPGTGRGDIGVLCLAHTGVARAMDRLLRAGIPVIELGDYGGAPVDAVKVGTVKRAKGLEFKQVLMGDVIASWLNGAGKADDDVEREQAERRRRELYVGMTRARDGLWVGVV